MAFKQGSSKCARCARAEYKIKLVLLMVGSTTWVSVSCASVYLFDAVRNRLGHLERTRAVASSAPTFLTLEALEHALCMRAVLLYMMRKPCLARKRSHCTLCCCVLSHLRLRDCPTDFVSVCLSV